MPELRLVEPAVNALVSRLNANLAAEITAINADVTDGHTIENPQQVLDYVPPLDLLTTFPTVCVDNQGGARFEDDNGWSPTGVFPLTVVAVLQNSDQQALTRQLRRYTLAIARVALENRNLGTGTGVPWSVQLQAVFYGPALETGGPDNEAARPPRAYWSFSAVELQCRIDEE